MLEVLGKNYYIDVDQIIEKCRPVYTIKEEEVIKKVKKGKDPDEHLLELNVFKFECYKSCVERILNEFQGDEDNDITAFTNKTANPSFGIAFNTLLKNGILIEDENE